MTSLITTDRGIGLNEDRSHLLAKANPLSAKADTFCRSPATNSPGQPLHVAGTFLGRETSQNHKKVLILGGVAPPH